MSSMYTTQHAKRKNIEWGREEKRARIEDIVTTEVGLSVSLESIEGHCGKQ